MSSGERVQQQSQPDQMAATTSVRQSRSRRHVTPMPSDDVIRNSIASNLTQILVNMQNANIQEKCRELLQVENLTQGAHVKILAALEQIDDKREQRERATNERKQRRAANKENYENNCQS